MMRRLFRIDNLQETRLTLLDLLPKRQPNGDSPPEVLQNMLGRAAESDLFQCEMRSTNGDLILVDIRISQVLIDNSQVLQMVIL